MYAYKSKVRILNDRELKIKLPFEVPEGEAEIIVITENKPIIDTIDKIQEGLTDRLDEWISRIPPVPHLPLSAFDRGELYK